MYQLHYDLTFLHHCITISHLAGCLPSGSKDLRGIVGWHQQEVINTNTTGLNKPSTAQALKQPVNILYLSTDSHRHFSILILLT